MDEDLDLRDIMLEATAEVQEIIREVMQELAAPMVKPKLQESWSAAPDEMKDQFATEHPDEYQSLMKGLEERRP